MSIPHGAGRSSHAAHPAQRVAPLGHTSASQKLNLWCATANRRPRVPQVSRQAITDTVSDEKAAV